MSYKRKTEDVWQCYVNYGEGFELETTESTFNEYKVNKKAYKENCQYPHYWKKTRENIEN